MTQPRLFGDGFTKTCRECDQTILFGKNKNGKWQPFDPEPHPSLGNFVVEDVDGEERFLWVPDETADQMRAAGTAVYVTHFDTCGEEPVDFDAPF